MLKLNPDVPNTDVAAGDDKFGSARNSVTRLDGTATPLIEKWLNDIYYALYAVVDKAGVVPSGTRENANTSDFYNSLVLLMNAHQSADFFNPTPQDTPDNTVKLSKAVVRDPDDPTSEPVQVAAGSADAITISGVSTGDTRRDRFAFDKTGAIVHKVGTPVTLPSPSIPPAYVAGEEPICQIFVSTDGTPVIDNLADIIIDERNINRLQKSDAAPGGIGNVVLQGRVNAVGTKNLEKAFGSGASFTVTSPATGIYDITLAGIDGTNVDIDVDLHGSNSGRFHNPVITDKTAGTGWGTKTGFRILTSIQVAATAVDTDTDFSFTVRRLD